MPIERIEGSDTLVKRTEKQPDKVTTVSLAAMKAQLVSVDKIVDAAIAKRDALAMDIADAINADVSDTALTNNINQAEEIA